MFQLYSLLKIHLAEEEAYLRIVEHGVTTDVADMIAVIRAGARGYVTKTISGVELSEAVHRVAEGDAVFSPRLAGFVRIPADEAAALTDAATA